jgi:Resolvase, N terminal domain
MSVLALRFVSEKEHSRRRPRRYGESTVATSRLLSHPRVGSLCRVRGAQVGNEVRSRWILRDAAQRKFDVLVFWSLDRLTRDGALQTLRHLNTLTAYGVAYRSLCEPYLDSCGLFKDAVVAILGTIARQEQVRIRERVRVGLERARKHGTRTSRPIGRPRSVFPRDQVVGLRAEGLSWHLGAKN